MHLLWKTKGRKGGQFEEGLSRISAFLVPVTSLVSSFQVDRGLRGGTFSHEDTKRTH